MAEGRVAPPGRPLPAHRQLADLVLIQLSNFRWSWGALVLTGCLTPLVSMFGLGLFARSSDPAALRWIYCGNLVVSLVFSNQNNVAANVAYMRLQGTLEYFALLPIRRPLLVVATFCAFFALSLPGLLATAVAGALLLDVPVSVSPLALLVVPLCVLPLAAIGALAGMLTPSPEQTTAVSLALTVLMTAIGPVVVPPAVLPRPLVLAGHLNPATYAASALRQVVLGPVTGRILLDLGVLAAVAVAVLAVLGRRLRWSRA